ncbi:anti sigma factor C-terminal domain-containing protein [Enterococcus sp. HY326]|uniref:anti sigma factor C-terminal domain-containing protein n=1 Tax=Enterococcus sp. HY326 TaxID=2971265 RepID=UPI0022404D59|nr:anti sigma factor C-terminal domain-containing protein [Enterococcus sp. HY326]
MTEKLTDLLEKYQRGEATAAEKNYVEERLKEFAALQEVLLEQEDSEVFELPNSTEAETVDSKKLKHQFNRKFLRLGLGVAGILLVVFAVLQWLLFPLANFFYFNPTEKVVHEEVVPYNIVAAIQTEVTSPLYHLSALGSQQDGIGKYIITKTYQSNLPAVPLSGNQETYEIVRGKVGETSGTLPAASSLIGRTSELSEESRQLFLANKEQTLEKLTALPATSEIAGGLTFATPLGLGEVQEFFGTESFFSDSDYRVNWFSVDIGDSEGLQLGFNWFATFDFAANYIGTSSSYLTDLNGQYPHLLPSTEAGATDVNLRQDFKEHFTSCLQYLLDNHELLKMQNKATPLSAEYLQQALDYIEENDVKITGVYFSATTERYREIVGADQVLDTQILGTELYSQSFVNS